MKKLQKMHFSNKKILIAAISLCMLLLAACGKPDISSYQDTPIRITGLTNEPFEVTPAQLIEMECVSVKAVGKTEKAGTVRGYGPELRTFVESYGKSLDDFSMIRAVASDGYVVLLGPVSWDNYQVVLSVGNGSKPLDGHQQPMRIVIPGGNSGNWARMVTSMEFVEK